MGAELALILRVAFLFAGEVNKKYSINLICSIFFLENYISSDELSMRPHSA